VKHLQQNKCITFFLNSVYTIKGWNYIVNRSRTVRNHTIFISVELPDILDSQCFNCRCKNICYNVTTALHSNYTDNTSVSLKMSHLLLAITLTNVNQFRYIFGNSQKVLIFPLHLTSASVLPGKTQKHKNCIFSLKCCCQTSTCRCLISSVLLSSTHTHTTV